MKQVAIGTSLKEGWRLFMLRPWYLFGLSIATMGLFMLAGSQGAVATALSYIVFGGYLALLIKHAKGQHVVFDDLFSIDQRWIYFAFLGIIKGVLILLGLLLFIIPGIYLMIRWMFAELYVIEDGMRPIEALRASSRLTEECRLKLFLFVLTTMLCLALGILCLGFGFFAAMTIVWFASITLFSELKKQNVPASTTENV